MGISWGTVRLTRAAYDADEVPVLVGLSLLQLRITQECPFYARLFSLKARPFLLPDGVPEAVLNSDFGDKKR